MSAGETTEGVLWTVCEARGQESEERERERDCKQREGIREI